MSWLFLIVFLFTIYSSLSEKRVYQLICVVSFPFLIFLRSFLSLFFLLRPSFFSPSLLFFPIFLSISSPLPFSFISYSYFSLSPSLSSSLYYSLDLWVSFFFSKNDFLFLIFSIFYSIWIWCFDWFGGMHFETNLVEVQEFWNWSDINTVILKLIVHKC